MKKTSLAVLLLCAALLLSGCGGSNGGTGGTRKAGGVPGVDQVLRKRAQQAEASSAPSDKPSKEDAALEETSGPTAEEAGAVETPPEEEQAGQTPSPQFQAAVDAALRGGGSNEDGDENEESGLVSSARPSALDPKATDYLEISPITIPPVIDWDLSKLSGTMAYAQLYNILVSPEQYIGKAFRLRGVYNELDNPLGDGSKFHFILVYDNAACCELALELTTTSRAIRPSYPPPGSLIEVTGIFDICYDQEQQFSCLRINDLTVTLEAGKDGVPAAPNQ